MPHAWFKRCPYAGRKIFELQKSMSAKRRRLSKTAYERLEREMADRKSPAESQARQERIKVLWGLDEQQLKAATKNPKEKQRKEQELKAQKLKPVLDSVRKLAGDDKIVARIHELRVELRELGEDDKVFDRIFDRIRELVELAGLQDREIEYLTQFRREVERIRAYHPEKFENLSMASLFAEMQPLIEKLSAEQKPNWEDKRRRHKLPGGIGLIEYEFGGAGEAYLRKHSLLPGQVGSAYEPTCLDNIFAGGTVRMRSEDVALNPSGPLAPFLSKTQHKAGLEELFGIERHRFGKGLPPIEKGRERSYDYRAVVKIMHRLLSEPREDKEPRRGKTPRLWPGNPALRIRVLIGIHERMESASVSEDIWGAFTAVVCFHLTKGIEGRLSQDVKNELAALVRRYLA